MSDTPLTDALVEKHQWELGHTRRTDDPTPLLKLAQDQAIESMHHARRLEKALKVAEEALNTNGDAFVKISNMYRSDSAREQIANINAALSTIAKLKEEA